ncbi:MAG: hypothetical protein KA174_09370, partial [Chitinophagales bacterium]|nr:hypothetical protein [Chitinophagales bacterium]
MKKLFLFTLSLSLSLSLLAQKDVVGANIDKTAKPGEDFFKYANGGWTKQNPIPAAYSQWGIGNLVQEDVWTKLKTINEKARYSGTIDPNTRKIHDFYFTAMDTITI